MNLLVYQCDVNLIREKIGQALEKQWALEECSDLGKAVERLEKEKNTTLILSGVPEVVTEIQNTRWHAFYSNLGLLAQTDTPNLLPNGVSRLGSVEEVKVFLEKKTVPPADAQVPEHQRKTVLLVDDVAIIRNIVAAIFSQSPQLAHLKYRSVGTVGQARFIMEKEPVDLLILDWMLPQITGVAYLREIRNDRRFKSLPVIMCTSIGEKEKVTEAASLGISSYLIKPIVKNDFIKKVISILPKVSV